MLITVDFSSNRLHVLCPSFMMPYFSLGLYFYFVAFLFFTGWLGVYFFRKQLLYSLLRLEFLVLSLFMVYLRVVSCVSASVSFVFCLLVLGACEATLGLSLLVSLVRLMGRDILGKFYFVKC